MSWMAVVIGVVILIAVMVVIGLVRSIIRILTALAAGVIIPALVYWGASAFGFAESIPWMVYVGLGVLSALSVLIGR